MTTPQTSTSASGHASTRSAAPASHADTPQGWISQTLRDLERWVAWSIGAYTAWLGLFAFPGVPVIWAFALYALLVGKWAEVHPSRNQAEMALRGVALIAGAYVLHRCTAGEVGGPAGAFSFWLSITCVAYAFMLKPAWAASVVLFAIVEFVAVSLQIEPNAAIADMIAPWGFPCIFPLLLAMKFGAVMRRPDDAMEGGRIDSGTALYNKAGLVDHGDAMLAASRRDRRPLSLAVFDCADLLEVRSIYGSRIARKVTARVVKKLNTLAGGQGLAARTGPAEFTVVLPGLGQEKALAAIQRVFGSPTRIEFDAGDSEIVLVPSFTVQVAKPEFQFVGDLYEALRRQLLRVEQQEQRRQSYLQRERERHSRPMGVSALAETVAPAKTGRQPPTRPAPLGAS